MFKQRLFLVTALAFGLSSFAFAQDAYRPERQWEPQSERPQERCAERYARKVARLAYLEARLNLTEQQKPAFAKWRQIKIDTADKRRASCLARQPGRGQNETAVEREARVEKRLSERLQTLQTTRPVLQALYESLSPEQKVVFDQAVARGHRHGHRWHRHGPRPM